MDILETNLLEIARNIYNKPPGPRCSIELELEDESAQQAGEYGVEKTVSDIVLFLTINGMEILFGHRDMTLLSYNNFILLKSYVNSYGYNPIVTANDTEYSPWNLSENGIALFKINIAFEKLR